MSGRIEHHELIHGETTIHYVEQGEGTPVVLLHGFPEFWYSWREQIPELAATGFRAIAPDLRGYNLSSKPQRLGSYRLAEVVADIAALVEHRCGGRAHLVGHDWGAFVAWLLAMHRPELVERLVSINIPHPGAVRLAMRRPDQMVRLSYQAFLQLPFLPEALLRARRFRRMKGAMKRLSKRPEALTPDVLARYEEAWDQPGALHGMLSYYRALLRRRRGFSSPGKPIVRIPTMLIWGLEDPFFIGPVMEATAEFATDLRIERLTGAGHFAQQDRPELVNKLIISFLS